MLRLKALLGLLLAVFIAFGATITHDVTDNKAKIAPGIKSTPVTSVPTLSLRDTSAAFDVTLTPTSTTALTSGRTLTLDVDNGARTLGLKKSLTVQTGDVTLSGNAAGSSVTLPASGTVATLAGSETLTNKTLGSTNTLTGATAASFTNTGTVTLPTATTTLVGRDTTDTLTNKTLDADGTGNAISNLEDADIKAGAAIARTKLASGTADHVLINDGTGVLSSEALLSKIRGGTGISSTATFPSSGVVVTEAGTQTLTNKTLTGNTAVNLISGSGTLTLNTSGTVTVPNATDTLVGQATADTLTNKTLTSPTINTPTVTSPTVRTNLLLQNATGSQPTLQLSEDPDNGTNKMTMQANASIADFTLTWPVDDGDSGQVLTTDGAGILTWTSPLTNPMDSAGDLIVGGAAGAATKLDSGTAGQLLVAQGAASPTWTDTVTTAKTFSGGLVGVTNGSSATAGHIGEVDNANLTFASRVGAAFTADQFGNVTSNTVAAGAYILVGIFQTDNTAMAGLATLTAAISANSGNTTTDHVYGLNEFATQAATGNHRNITIIWYVSVSGSTTYYLKAKANAGTTMADNFFGSLHAIRIR